MLHNEHSDVKVSIVTVIYNAVGKIEPTLQSVLGQKYSNIEYIVIDGESTDGTLEVINRYRNRIDMVISEKDNGIYDALNKGVLKATGDWIGIMNAGDVFADENVLSKVFRNDRNLEGVDVIYGDAVSVDGSVEVLCKASENIDDLKKGPCYRHGASFVKSTVHKKYLFDVAKKSILEFALDYEQIYRMYRNGCSFRKISFPVVNYELRGVSTVSPFKITYYNYLITHDMKCRIGTRVFLWMTTIWHGGQVVIGRFYAKWNGGRNDNI
jgi:glycosyltransferase involved in cell wall biosynthesis